MVTFKEGDLQFIQGDCLSVMEELAYKGIKVDAVICDPPYNIVNCKWDNLIPFNKHIIVQERNKDKILYKDEALLYYFKQGLSYKEANDKFNSACKEGMWDKLDKITYDNSPVVLFGNEPFSSSLRQSNIKYHKYDIAWQKERPVNILQMKKRIGKTVENIMLFYKKQCTYNPQMTKHTGKLRTNKVKNGSLGTLIDGQNKKATSYRDDRQRYPLDVQKFNRDILTSNLHKTQKPLALMEWLVKTYTNEGDMVLDFTAGSFTTGVACANLNRKFIGIELEEEYFNIGVNRIKENLMEENNG